MEKLKARYSNFELLRIISMVMVLVIHVLICLPRPTTEMVEGEPFKAICFYLTDAISIICVNIFILISGWFGIKFDIVKLGILLFQVLFFSISVWCVLFVINPERYLNIQSVSTILMLDHSDYWFIKSYLGLFLLSPLINTYIEHASRKQYQLVLLLLFSFQTIYGWLSIDGADWIAGGYSAFSFVCLYLLGRYLRIYGENFYFGRFHKLNSIPTYYLVYIFMGIVIILIMLAFVVTYFGIPIEGRLFTYTNPLVILEACVLLLIFSRLRLKSVIINRVAASCLAIYLLHGNRLVLRPFYGKVIAKWFQEYSINMFLLKTLLLMALAFILAIVIDQIRLVLSNLVFKNHKII